jgi:RNA polymerase sigma factor (sigma-70 family)
MSSLLDPAALLVQQLPLVDQVARAVARKGGSTAADQEEFVCRARLKMVENDYAVLRKFKGESLLGTYLRVVLERLFVDERVRKWGRHRTSAPARRMGTAAQRIEVLRRDGLSSEETWTVMTTNEGWTLTRDEFERMVAALPPPKVRPRETDDSALASQPAPGAEADAEVQARERQRMAAHTWQALRCALLRLTKEERLILKMRYLEDLTVGAVAKATGLTEKPLFRRFERLLARLRADLESQGVDAGDLEAILGEDAPDDLPGEDGGH